MKKEHAIAIPGRPLVWAALIVVVCSAAYTLLRLENLPTATLHGTLSGVISAVSSEADGVFIIEDAFFEYKGDASPVGGAVRLNAQSYAYPLGEGQLIRAEVTLSPLQKPVNPYGYDERMLLFSDGIVYSATGAVLSHEGAFTPSFSARMQSAVLASIQSLWPQAENQAMITALLLGTTDDLSDEMYAAFRRSGTAHLLSVSGLHVGFVMMLAAFCFKWMRRNSRMQVLLILLCVISYAMLARSAFSVLRATLMLSVSLFARHQGRKSDTASALSIAVIVALVLRPMQVFTASFLLSTSAVMGIALLSPRLEHLLRFIKQDSIRSSVVLTTSAQLGVLPVQLWVFHSLPTLSLFSNLICVPLSAGIVMLGLPAALLNLLFPALAAVPAFVVQLLCRMLALVCTALAEPQFATIYSASPPILVLLCTMGVLFLLSKYLGEFKRKTRRVLICGMLCATMLSLGLWLPFAHKDEATVTFLSVGTSDCTLLRSPTGNVLIDTGWTGSQAKRYIQGEALTIDALILTHRDGDHTGGLATLLSEAAVGAIYFPLGMEQTEFAQALSIAKGKGIPVRTLRAGDEMTVGDFSIEVLSPAFVRPGHDNEDSLVLVAKARGTSLLFLGDITSEIEDQLPLPSCDIVKISHHGSATATTEQMLRRVDPDIAVICVGTPNAYGFPAPDVLSRLENASVPVYRTDQSGAITVTLAPGSASVQAYAPPTLRTQWLGIP